MTKTLCRSDGPCFHPSRRRPSRAALALSLSFLTLLAFPSVRASAKSRPSSASIPVRTGFVQARTIGEVLSAWRPQTHLYVLGDVGLEKDALRELAAWIGDRHWTVLLVADANGQTYRDADGVLRQGEDALDYGAGQGIPRRAGFSAQVHPRTGQPDGAILTIVLAQHALFYTGSQAQDSRGLGEDQFHGNLDQWAIKAMRSGGDIASAIKDTITNVDARLTAVLDQEAQRIETARLGVQSAAAWLSTLEEKAAGLRALHPALSGEVARPDVQALRQRLAITALTLETDPEGVIRTAAAIQQQAAAEIKTIEDYPAQGRALEDTQARIADLERRKRAASAREELARARGSLATARRLYDRGAPGYAERLDAAKAALSQAETRVASADAAAALGLLTLRFLLFVLAAALLAAGVVLNRRRRSVKREAEQLLAAWRTALDRKLAALFDELERRVDRFIGPASGEGKRPHTGETLRLAEQIRADVGSLSILWTSASSILEKAEALIQAKGLAAVYNVFFSGRYRKGITLLKDEPVPFDPADGLPRLFGVERTWRDDLLGDLASYEPFRKSFQEIVAELDLRARRATEALDLVESSLTQGPAVLEETAARLRQTASAQGESGPAGAGAGLFRVPAVFTEILPAAEALLARGRALFATDPVGALRGDIARAGRIAEEAARLVELAAEIRRVDGVVQGARGELGSALGLPAERILREVDADPSERLDAAARQAGTAQEKLGSGDLDAAAAALAETARLTAEAEAIVAATRQAFAAQEATVRERHAETERIERLLPDHERILAGIRETFAPSVLSLRAGDPEHPDANGTLADNLDEARAHVELCHGKLDRAVAAFPIGHLLEAARLLREVKGHQELAVHRLEEIAERQARLARTVASNRALLATLEERVREDRLSIAGDPRVMPPTVAAFEDGERRVQQARALVEAVPGDPLAAEGELLAVQSLLGEVRDRMAPSDRLRFAEAQKSVEAAARQLAAAGDLARRALGDRIPDSPGITQGLEALGSLTAAQVRAREALGVPHGDWNALDAEADRITAEAARWTATLQGEVAAGERAVKALATASSAVREAGSWRGAYGVIIAGSPGSGSLSRARSLLEQGRYAEAEQEAADAQREAAAAIAAAQEQVSILRAEERRREEERREERRRREAASRSFLSSSGSSGSSGSRGSSWGSGSSSGSGRSSWGSSGSGSGKSGW